MYGSVVAALYWKCVYLASVYLVMHTASEARMKFSCLGYILRNGVAGTLRNRGEQSRISSLRISLFPLIRRYHTS